MNIIPSFTRSLASLTLALSLPFAAAGQAGEAGEALGFSRVGRIVDLQGDVALYDPQADEWTEALRNRPLVAGDRLVLQRSARAELRVGSTVLLLGQGAEPAPGSAAEFGAFVRAEKTKRARVVKGATE